jgi:hypothetical protein
MICYIKRNEKVPIQLLHVILSRSNIKEIKTHTPHTYTHHTHHTHTTHTHTHTHTHTRREKLNRNKTVSEVSYSSPMITLLSMNMRKEKLYKILYITTDCTL